MDEFRRMNGNIKQREIDLSLVVAPIEYAHDEWVAWREADQPENPWFAEQWSPENK